MKNKICSLLFITFIFILNINVYADDRDVVKFKRCIDGDTALFILNNEEIRVRFLAIDTPETVHPTKKEEKHGKDASEYTCNKITNAENIVLEYDEASTKKDKYNRVLAWVWADDELLQKELITLGYAKIKYIYGDYKYINELYELEDIAKTKQLGVWNNDFINFLVTFQFDDQIKEVEVRENDLLTEFIPEKEGYKFKAWLLKDKTFDFNTRIDENITLVAEFEKVTTSKDIFIIIFIMIFLYFTNKKMFKKKLKKLF